MGRIRSIKPEFFKHEDLFDLEQETGLPVRVAFAGLWTCCDREGRFKWKPRQLKSDILPHDDIDFSRVLDALWTRGFVTKYRVESQDYGYIPTWHTHQVINNRESKSAIPEPSETFTLQAVDASATRQPRVSHANRTRGQSQKAEGKGREGIGKEEELKPSARKARSAKSQPAQVSEALAQTKHKRIEGMIKTAWEDHNPGAGACPFGEADGAQLKLMLKKTTSWPDSNYAQCLVNMYATEGFPRSELPVHFLPRLPSYFSGPKDRYNRELGNYGNGNSKAERLSADIHETTRRIFDPANVLRRDDAGRLQEQDVGGRAGAVARQPLQLTPAVLDGGDHRSPERPDSKSATAKD